MLMSTAILRALPAGSPPQRPSDVIFGAGLAKDPELPNKMRSVILSAKAKMGEFVPLREFTEISSLIIEAIGTRPEWLLDEVYVLGAPAPIIQSKPGDLIASPKPGTVGCNVKWGADLNQAGFLTAGHVGKPLNVDLLGKNKTPIGQVVYFNDPAGHGNVIEADVALIEIPEGSKRSDLMSNLAKAGPGDSVYVMSRGKRVQAEIMGFNHFLRFPAQNGTCGDMYSTTEQVTTGGDSGAPVVDANNSIIGHVIGASPGYQSYIQGIDYQLHVLSGPPGFTTIQI